MLYSLVQTDCNSATLSLFIYMYKLAGIYLQAFANLSDSDCSLSKSVHDCLNTGFFFPPGDLYDHLAIKSTHRNYLQSVGESGKILYNTTI